MKIAMSLVWQIIKPWPSFWKFLFAISVGTFATLVMIWAFGLEWILFDLLNIHQ